ncbi:MAG: GNAT family N-acetyltransferase [Microthrixaceae bacterium]
MGDETLRDLEPERLDAHLDVHAVDPGQALWESAEQFVYDVFRISGFCGESPRRFVEETEPWRAGSRLHVITERSSVVGVARTIIGRYDELPVSQFEPEIEVPDGELCEIGSLAVRPTQRGLGVANELHRRAFREGFDRRVAGFCFLVDQWMFDFFRDQYGLPVRALAAPRRFMGGDVVPTGMWMPEMLHVIARIRPNVYRWSVEGLSPRVFREMDLPAVID